MSWKWLRKLNWQVAAIAVACAGIIHICATLFVPQLATGGAVQRLTADLPANRMRVLPLASPTYQPLAFTNPDMRYAVFRFDVGSGPVAVSALLPDKGWTMALYTLDGDNFYVVPAQDGRKTEVSFVLVPQGDRLAGGGGRLGRTAAAADVSASQITVPQPEGLVVVRAPLRWQSYAGQLEAQLARAACAPKRS